MNITFNTNGILEINSPLIYDGGNIDISIVGTFSAGDYDLQFRRGNIIVSETELSVDMEGTILTEFLETEFDLVRKNRIALEIYLLKDGLEIGSGIITCKRESAVDLVSEPTTGTHIPYNQKQIVKANPDTGEIISPDNFFSANNQTIYDAIENLIDVPATFDATTATHLGTTTGNLAGTTTVQQLANVVDALTGGDNLGSHTATTDLNMDLHAIKTVASIDIWNGNTNYKTLASDTNNNLIWDSNIVLNQTNYSDFITIPDAAKSFCLPFTYMQLSKCFGNLGWVTEEVSGTNYYFSCGGYESANASLQNGTSYIEFLIPPGATEFATTGAIQLYLYGNSTTATNCKYDLTIYATKNGTTGKTNLYSATGQTLSSTSVPTFISIDKASLITNLTTASLTTGDRRIVIEIEFYSKSNYSVKLLQGAINLIG